MTNMFFRTGDKNSVIITMGPNAEIGGFVQVHTIQLSDLNDVAVCHET